jgi:hypothetical protein
MKKTKIIILLMILNLLSAIETENLGHFFPPIATNTLTNDTKSIIDCNDDFIAVGCKESLEIYKLEDDFLQKQHRLLLGCSIYYVEFIDNDLFVFCSYHDEKKIFKINFNDIASPDIIQVLPETQVGLEYIGVIDNHLFVTINGYTEIYTPDLDYVGTYNSYLGTIIDNHYIKIMENDHFCNIYTFNFDTNEMDLISSFDFQNYFDESEYNKTGFFEFINNDIAVFGTQNKLISIDVSDFNDWQYLEELDITAQQAEAITTAWSLPIIDNYIAFPGFDCIQLFSINSYGEFTLSDSYNLNSFGSFYDMAIVRGQTNDFYAISLYEEGLSRFVVENGVIEFKEKFLEYNAPSNSVWNYPYMYGFARVSTPSIWNVEDVQNPILEMQLDSENIDLGSTIKVNKKNSQIISICTNLAKDSLFYHIYSYQDENLILENAVPRYVSMGDLISCDLENHIYYYNNYTNGKFEANYWDGQNFNYLYSIDSEEYKDANICDSVAYVLSGNDDMFRLSTYVFTETNYSLVDEREIIIPNNSSIAYLEIQEDNLFIIFGSVTYIYKITDTENPILLSKISGAARGNVIDNYLFCSLNNNSSISIFDLNDSAEYLTPIYFEDIYTMSNYNVFEAENNLYLQAKHTHGYDLYRIDFDVDNEIVITPVKTNLKNYPNPFSNSANSRNSGTNISFTIEKRSDVEISVYNSKGQKVRTLTKENYDAGEHSVFWNGKNESNKKVASGVYLYRMNVDGRVVQTNKCLVVK